MGLVTVKIKIKFENSISLTHNKRLKKYIAFNKNNPYLFRGDLAINKPVDYNSLNRYKISKKQFLTNLREDFKLIEYGIS